MTYREPRILFSHQISSPAWIACIRLDAGGCKGQVATLLPRVLDLLRPDHSVLLLDAELADEFHAALSGLCGESDHRKFRSVEVPCGVSFVEAIRYVMRALPGRDIAYAHARTELLNDWDLGLARAASDHPHVGVVSPLSDALPEFSPFGAERPAWMSVGQVTPWLAELSHGAVFDTPGVLEWCAYYRWNALVEIGVAPLPDGVSLPVAMRSSGWACVGCDWVFAGWRSGRDQCARELLGHPEDVRQFLTNHPLARIRHGFGEVISRASAGVQWPSTDVIKPVQLHITHSWGGGLGRWVRDMCEGDAHRHNLVLRSIGTWGTFGQRIALYPSHEMGPPLREWQLDLPIRSVATAHHQYRELLEEVIRDFDVDVLLISSFIGHSLDALDMKLPTLVVAHDYFPFCPALVIHFDSVCIRCDAGRLRDCFSANPLNRFFSHAEASDWISIRKRYLAAMGASHVRLVAPSASVIGHLAKLAPSLASVQSDVVAHGIDILSCEPYAPGDGRLKLVVLGSLAPHKGLKLLEAALPALLEFADVHLLGCGEDGASLGRFHGVELVPQYKREDLPRLVQQIRPHAGLLLSIVPETFSYTLSELWALGVPPIATRLGSFTDRIDHLRTGYLVDADPEQVVSVVKALDVRRELLLTMREEVCRLPVQRCVDMIADYHRLAPVNPGRGSVGKRIAGASSSAQSQSAIYVDKQVPIRVVVCDFIDYLIWKARATPRLRLAARRVLVSLLQGVRIFFSGKRS